ncbi:MAG: ABC transporter ATP-binding protein [Chloroflexota bacterium]
MIIRVNHLGRKFGSFVAVNDVSFEIPEGQIFGFLGPNGSGKTTTIRMLLGLVKPTSGTAYILNQDIHKASRHIMEQIGYMSQKFSLYTDLTVAENLTFFGRSYGLFGNTLRQRMDAILEMTGLKGQEAIPTRDLSGGWAQRLALGAAIIHQPKLLFLDEPTAGVDPVSRREFWDLLYELAQSGTTVFVTTHYMDEAEHCQRVAFIYYGKLIADAPPHELVQTTVPGQIISFEPSDPLRALQVIKEAIQLGTLPASSSNLFGAAIHVLSTDGSLARDRLQAMLAQQGISVNAFRIEKPSLEDAFINLVQGQKLESNKIRPTQSN